MGSNTRKLKAVWTQEIANDFAGWHGSNHDYNVDEPYTDHLDGPHKYGIGQTLIVNLQTPQKVYDCLGVITCRIEHSSRVWSPRYIVEISDGNSILQRVIRSEEEVEKGINKLNA